MLNREVERMKKNELVQVPGLRENFVYRDSWTRLNVKPAKIMQVFIHVHENIKEPQLTRLRTAFRPRCLSPNAQNAFRSIPGLISCTGMTGSVGATRHARTTQIAGLNYVAYAWQPQVCSTCLQHLVYIYQAPEATIPLPHKP